MSTSIYLTTTAADAAVTAGSGTKKKTAFSSNSSAQLYNKNTVAGNTPPLQLTDSGTEGVDGTAISWYTPPLAGVFLGSNSIDWHLWVKESSSLAQVAVCVRLERCSGDGTALSTIFAETLNQGGGEITTTAGGATRDISISAANVTDTTLLNGDRLRITLWIDDAVDQGTSGVMSGSRNAQFWVNGPDGSQGQARLVFIEALTEYVTLLGLPAETGSALPLSKSKSKSVGIVSETDTARIIISTPSAYATEVIADSPVVWLKLDEASGTLADSSGNSHAMTASGTPTYAQASLLPAESSASLKLNSASTDYLSGTWGTDVTPITEWTIECWLKLSTLPGSGTSPCIFVHEYTPDEMPLVLGFNLGGGGDQRIGAGFYDSGGNWRAVHWSTIPTTGVVYHVIATASWNGSNTALTLRVNGTEVATASPAVQPSASADTTVYVGRRWDSNQLINGYLQHLSIYATALSPTRQVAHYTAGIASGIINQATETDSSLALTHAKTKSVEQSLETDSSLEVSPTHLLPIGQSSETDVALPITVSVVTVVHQAAETDTASGVSESKSKVIGIAESANVALDIRPTRRITVGLASEVDSSLSLVVEVTPVTPAPDLLYPAPGQSVPIITPVFTADVDEEAVLIEVEYSLDEAFTAPIAMAVVLPDGGTVSVRSGDELTVDTVYYWRVRTQRSDASWSDWSEVRAFFIDLNSGNSGAYSYWEVPSVGTPDPFFWAVVPRKSQAGLSVELYGSGFGLTEGTVLITINGVDVSMDVTSWQLIAPSVNAYTSTRAIETITEVTIDPEHYKVVAGVPVAASAPGGPIRVVTA